MSKTFPVTMGRSGIQLIENLQIYDLIWGLANLNRFTGKTDRNVSVAAHSLHCYNVALVWQPDNHDLHLYALLHDLPEGYYGDFPGFLKKHLGAEFEKTLSDIDDLILSQCGLSKDVRVALDADLRRIDSSTLTLEARYGFNKFEPYHWPPVDLYDDDGDLISELTAYTPIGIYNLFVNTLTEMGEYNEILKELLYRHRSYSHPHYVRNEW